MRRYAVLPARPFVAALLVRRAVRHVVLTGLYLTVAAGRLRLEPGLRGYLAFVRRRPLRISRTIQSLSANAGGITGEVDTRVRVKSSPAPAASLLLDMRVRRLQERAARVLLTREFGLNIAGSEAAVLGTFSSLAWLRRNLLTAAGCNAVRSIRYEELRERCHVVYPAFIRAMTMHRCVLESNLAPRRENVRGRWLRYWRRRYRVGAHGEILDSFYPRAIPDARRRLRRYEQREETRHAYRRERTAYQLLRFDRYLDAITLIAKAGVTNPARAARTLDAMHRVYQRNTSGGDPWLRGTRNRKKST